MSYCKSNGKDKVVFVTKDDAEKPPMVAELLNEEEYGVILPDGSINWDCPCLGGLPTGPCGEEFKSSFSCFHYSDADPKGADCIEEFVAMQECFKSHPELYSKYDDIDNDENDDQLTDDNTTTINSSSNSTTDNGRTNDDNNDNKE